MTDTRLAKPHEPNALLGAIYGRFFDRIRIDETWIARVRELADQGLVVYVLRSVNLLDFLALDYLTRCHELPRIHFVNDLGPWWVGPTVAGDRSWLFRRRTPAEQLQVTLENDRSAVLFLKRPPGVLEVAAGATRGRELKDGDELVQTLFDAQRASSRPILLLPQVFVWTPHPDTRGLHPLDFLLGPREWPTTPRTVAELLQHSANVQLRVGAPVNLTEYLHNSEGVDDEPRVRRLTYMVLRRLERERRSVTGPAVKSPDRVRSEILRSPRLQTTIRELAGEQPNDRRAVAKQAERMLRELQATPDQATIAGLKATVHRVFHKIYAGIEFDQADLDRLREASKDHTLILLPSHKSHVDYLLLSYLFRQEGLPLPVIAAGENLNFFPIGPILRRGGAFFIRRTFKGDRLYAAVVEAYVRRLIRDGFPIEVFLEGGRSRSGKLLPPKYGMLRMIVEAAVAQPARPTAFVPISIGYERVVEAGEYERELRGGEKQKEDAGGLLESRKLLRHRYGRINLQIGRILTLGEFTEEPTGDDLAGDEDDTTRALVTRIGHRVMDEINQVTAVTPGALVALSLLSHTKDGLPHAELVVRCQRLLRVLQMMGARVTPATTDEAGELRPEALQEALQMFMEAELLEAYPADESGGRRRWRRHVSAAGEAAYYVVPVGKRIALDTSKNIIIHFFLERSMVALSMLASPEERVPLELVRERVGTLSRLFKYEFRYRTGVSMDELFDQTLRGLEAVGIVEVGEDGLLAPGCGSGGWSGQDCLEAYRDILWCFVEGYRVAARGLTHLLRGPMTQKDLVKKTLSTGGRMFLAGEITRREAVNKLILQNAFSALGDEHYLEVSDGKLSLAESFRSPDAAAAIEGRIAAFLPERA